MGISRIEQLIDDIYEFVESCKMSPLSQTKVVIPKDELYDLLDELKLRTPDEIKRYQKIIANRESILADAEKRAEEIKESARAHANELVNENEIMQQVYQKANEIMADANSQAESIIRSANEDADQIRSGALLYTNDILTEAENTLRESYESSKMKAELLINSLKVNLDIVSENRKEIHEQLNPHDANTAITQNLQDIEDYSNIDYDFPEGKFLEDID